MNHDFCEKCWTKHDPGSECDPAGVDLAECMYKSMKAIQRNAPESEIRAIRDGWRRRHPGWGWE